MFCHAQIFLCYYEYQSDLLTSEIFCIFINYWQENIFSEKYFIMCLLTDFSQLSFSTTLEIMIFLHLWPICLSGLLSVFCFLFSSLDFLHKSFRIIFYNSKSVLSSLPLYPLNYFFFLFMNPGFHTWQGMGSLAGS